jgi:hypothetical protein
MKNLKTLLWTITLVMVSFGIVAMEAPYKPKIYISNQNTKSLVGASIGIKCIVNGVLPDVQSQDGMAFYVAPGEDKVIGQLGMDLATDIVSLDLQPSSGGKGILSGIGKVTVYPLTEHLNAMLSQLNQHPNQDIVIIVDNNTRLGYWQFEFLWRDRVFAEAMPIQAVAKEQAKRPAPQGGPAKTIGKKREIISISTVTKEVKGQGAGSMWQAMVSPDLQAEMNTVLQKRRKALEGK